MRTTTARLLREAALWTGALAGLVALAVALAVVMLRAELLVFRSGSMSPAVETGALALALPVEARDIRPGDIVSVTDPAGSRVTHRVVSSTLRGDEATLVLQGDANATPDAEAYVVRSAVRVVADVPLAGYAVAYAQSPPGLVTLIAIGLILLLLAPSRADVLPGAAVGGRHRRQRRARAVAAVTGAVVASASVGAVSGTSAAFSDTGTMTTGSFGAATAAPPTSVGCVDNGLADYVRWTAPTSYTPTKYVVYVASAGNVTTYDVAPPLTTWSPNPSFLGLGTYHVQVAARRGSFESTKAGSVSITVITVLGALVSSC